MTPTEARTLLAIAPNSPEESVLRLLIELGAQFVHATEGSLLVLDRAAGQLVFAMTAGGSSDLIGQIVPLNSGITGLAAATHEVQLGAPTFELDAASTAGAGPTAVIAAPMLVADELIGVLTAVSFDRDRVFSGSDAELYGRLASVAALVVHQRTLLDRTASAATPTGDGSPEARIAAALSRIARARPRALGKLADLVESAAALASADEGH